MSHLMSGGARRAMGRQIGEPGHRRPNRRKGFILFLSLVMLTGALALTTFGLSRSLAHLSVVSRSIALNQAFQMAEAGLNESLAGLRSSSSYGGTTYVALGTLGGYEIIVADSTTVPALAANQRQITVTGHFPSNNPAVAGYVAKRERVIVTISLAFIPGPLIARMQLSLPRGAIDSYDSSQGSYASQVPGNEADLFMTNTANGRNRFRAPYNTPVYGPTGTTIHGDILLDPNGNTLTDVHLENPSGFYGVVQTETVQRTLPPVQIPNGLINAGCIALADGEVRTLPGGNYLFECLGIPANAQLSFTGPATVYTRDIVEIGYSGPNTNGFRPCIATYQNKPENFVLYVSPEYGAYVSIWDMGDFYGVIYAPDTGVYIQPYTSPQGMNIYGAIVSGDVWFDSRASMIPGPVNVHYDTELRKIRIKLSNQDTIRVDFWDQY